MSHLRIRNGIVTYPYALAELRRDHPDISFPHEMPVALLAEFDVHPVEPVPRPAPSDPITLDVVEAEPAVQNGVWAQRWVEIAAPPREIAARRDAASDAAARSTVRADSFVTAFIAMSPAEVAAYVDANVTSLATAKTVLAKVAVMLLLLARREFRDAGA